MKQRNEKTSPRVVKIAAKVLAMSDRELTDWIAYGRLADLRRDIRALAASCLTQAPPKGENLPARKQTASGMPRGGTKPANATSGQIRGSNPVERKGRSPFYPGATGKRRSP